MEPTVCGVIRPRAGESRCGDQWRAWHDPGRLTLALADGLGHGPEAERAALAALACIDRERGLSLPALFAACDEALRGGRGAALGVARLHLLRGELEYAAVGNTRALLLGETIRRLAGCNGIIGAGFQPLLPVRLPVAPGELLLLYSDGLPELVAWGRHLPVPDERLPRALARALAAEATDQDDAALVACRWSSP